MESLGDVPVKIRFTWDTKKTTLATWKIGTSIGGGLWSLIEEYVMKPN